MPTRRVGNPDWLVRIGRLRYTCIASAETSSAGIRCAISSATALFPEAVGPKMARTSSATQPVAGELELLRRHARFSEILLDPAVAPLELREHAGHRGCGRLRDSLEPLELRVGLGGGEPRLVPRPQPLLAEGVVGRDRRVIDSRQV